MSGVSHLVAKLRVELKSRGAHGIHGLGRKFKIMDDDGSKSLNMAEFKKAMQEMNIKSLNEADLRYTRTYLTCKFTADTTAQTLTVL